MPIVRTTRDATWRQANARARRQALRAGGVDPGLVAATPDAELLTLFPPQLRLVPDAELVETHENVRAELYRRMRVLDTLSTDAVEDLAPRLGTPISELYDDGADERASTLYFLERMRGNTPQLPEWFGGDDPTFGGAA